MLVLHKVDWLDIRLCSVCADSKIVQTRSSSCLESDVSALLFIKTCWVFRTFHTRQNNSCEKRARDKLNFSISAQLRAHFRLLINRSIPVSTFKDSSLSSAQVTVSMCVCAYVRWQDQIIHKMCVEAFVSLVWVLVLFTKSCSLSECDAVPVCFPSLPQQINSVLVVHHLKSKCSCRLHATRFMYLALRGLPPFQLCVLLFVNANWMW